MKTALVLGSSGLIGSHLVKRLQQKKYFVIGADIQEEKYSKADIFHNVDLREQGHHFLNHTYDEVYQLAADMGGALWVFSGEHDADIMHNSAMINLNICESFKDTSAKIFYSSSACMYPQEIQHEESANSLPEHLAYPANPDSEYGWEKLFSERLYLAYKRNYGLNVRIARFHNIFGVEGTWEGGREKYPAAIARKVAQAKDGETIVVWGNGKQVRSYLNVDECINCIFRLMESECSEPLNIGSDESITCNDLAKMVIEISGKDLKIEHDLTKPQGVRGRNSDNTLIQEKLGYAPKQNLRKEMEKLYNWINKQVSNG